MFGSCLFISCKKGPVPANSLMWKWSQLGVISGLTRLQRETLAKRTVQSGSLAAVRLLVTGEDAEDVGSLAPSASVIRAAAGAGQLAVVQHLRQLGCPLPRDFEPGALAAAARKGQTEMCLCFVAESCPGSCGVLPAAAFVGQVDTCEPLLAVGCPWSPEAAGAAAADGHVSLMRRLLQLSEEQPDLRSTDFEALQHGAAGGLDLAALQSLHAQYMQQIAVEKAAAVGTRVLKEAALGHTADHQQKIDRLSRSWARATRLRRCGSYLQQAMQVPGPLRLGPRPGRPAALPSAAQLQALVRERKVPPDGQAG
jgi:hypothetical protein